MKRRQIRKRVDPMKCATHPNVETGLTCVKCDKPICPKCMVLAPVGARCPECAKLYKLPTYRVTPIYYLRAVGAASAMSIACGLLWAFINLWSPFFLNFLLAAGIGYAIAQVISRSVNRKRGTGLAVVAGAAVVTSYLISLVPFGRFFTLSLNPLYLLIQLGALALGVWIAFRTLR
ncbi:hypothetical protein ACFLRP_02795 [Bacteroidota bacterium]